MLFDIPEFVMPTEEELRASSAAWYKRAGATFLDNYSQALTALAPKTELIEWPKHLTEAFFAEGQSDLPQGFQPLSDAIDRACAWSWKFLRLNSRSPKDVMLPGEFVTAGRQALLHIRTSERCLEDLALFSYSPYPAYIALRQPLFIRPGYEFRLFVRDGDLLGVAQYHRDIAGDLADPNSREAIHRSIINFYERDIRPALTLDTVVVDICFSTMRKWQFLEINPYGLSDPCAALSYQDVEANPGKFHVYAAKADLVDDMACHDQTMSRMRL
jgi:hypothetical protein